MLKDLQEKIKRWKNDYMVECSKNNELIQHTKISAQELSDESVMIYAMPKANNMPYGCDSGIYVELLEKDPDSKLQKYNVNLTIHTINMLEGKTGTLNYTLHITGEIDYDSLCQFLTKHHDHIILDNLERNIRFSKQKS